MIGRQRFSIELLMQQENPQRELMPLCVIWNRFRSKLTSDRWMFHNMWSESNHQDFDMMMLKLPQTLTPGKEQAQFWGSAAADEGRKL